MQLDPLTTAITAVTLLGLAAMAKSVRITLKGWGVEHFTIQIKR
jgi:hypothetical protein